MQPPSSWSEFAKAYVALSRDRNLEAIAILSLVKHTGDMTKEAAWLQELFSENTFADF